MPRNSRILQVPYFVQPDATHCQATCLKMFACHVERHITLNNRGAFQLRIEDIKNTINADPRRPNKVYANHQENMAWWLRDRYAELAVHRHETTSRHRAAELITKHIDSGFPVILSISHARTRGHIILAVGYEHLALAETMGSVQVPADRMEERMMGQRAAATSTLLDLWTSPSDAATSELTYLRIVVHDPYGQLEPQLGSELYGAGRFTGGFCTEMSEHGPGQYLRLRLGNIARTRADDLSAGTFRMITASRRTSSRTSNPGRR